MINYGEYFTNILYNYSHPMIIMSAEFDMQDGAIGEDIWMKSVLKGQLPDEYWTNDRSIYYFQNEGEELMRVGGYYRQQDKFTTIAVPKAGHMIPITNYDASKAMVDDMA